MEKRKRKRNFFFIYIYKGEMYFNVIGWILIFLKLTEIFYFLALTPLEIYVFSSNIAMPSSRIPITLILAPGILHEYPQQGGCFLEIITQRKSRIRKLIRKRKR